MPLDAADPRPRNQFGQFSPGAALSPDQMNRAYGIRTKVLASILSTRPTMKTIPALPAKDIARISGLAAKARSLVNLEKLDLGEKPIEPTPECCPCAAKPAKVWYPSIYIGSRTNAGDKLAQIPRKGKAVIEYRVRDITTTEDADGKVSSSASLEVQSIDPVAEGGAQVAPVAGAEFAARLERLIGFGCGGKRPAKELMARVLRTPVELAATSPIAGDKIPRPRFVEDDGFVKIVRSDGTASEIGRAPGFANRLRRNKGKLIVGGLGAVAGALAAKKLLGGKKAA